MDKTPRLHRWRYKNASKWSEWREELAAAHESLIRAGREGLVRQDAGQGAFQGAEVECLESGHACTHSAWWDFPQPPTQNLKGLGR